MAYDRIDLSILDLLQHDVRVPLARIADRAGLSQTPCWKRIRKLEESGVIKGRVALLDPGSFGLSLTAFVLVEAADQTPAWRQGFLATVEAIPSVRDVYRLAGRQDFLLRVLVADVAALDALVECLRERVPLRSCGIMMVAEQSMGSTALPLPVDRVA